jgi:hypothetical protein
MKREIKNNKVGVYMKQKKIPLRMCVVTREKYDKRELLRIVRTKEGNVFIDKTSKMNGKGAYLKKDIEVINKARKNKILDRVLEIEVPDNLYDEMLNNI